MAAGAIFLACVYVKLAYPVKYLDIINENVKPYGFDTAFVCAVIHAESKFTEEARSHAGASGLMQLTEGTANWVAAEMKLTDYHYDRVYEPEINIKIGCYYLGWLLNHYENDTDLVIAAYNAGNGNVDKWLKNPEYSSEGKMLENIPFKETRDYLSRVKFNYRVYSYLLKLNS